MKNKKGKTKKIISYCFIDASNLFYGGEKVLGWKVDYFKLKKYLEKKYEVKKIFYYGGIDVYDFKYDFTSIKDFPIDKLISHLQEKLVKESEILQNHEIILLSKHIRRAKFYRKLSEFGYILKLKPVKKIRTYDGEIKRKADCDVNLTFDSMRLQRQFNRFVLLSGDGDFEILLKYFQENGKEIIILSTPERTAINIKKKFSKQYRNFYEIRSAIEWKK